MEKQVLELQKELNIKVKNKMAKTNTEKPTGKSEKKKINTNQISNKKTKPVTQKIEKSKSSKNIEDKNKLKKSETENKKLESKEQDIEQKKQENLDKEKIKQKKPVIKKEKAIVNGFSLPISTKDSVAICNFIRYKNIEKAINELEQVVKKKSSIPIKGEIPHKKDSSKIGSGSAKYPKKASEVFIKLLQSLKSNSENNGIEEPVIALVFANKASRPFGRFGRIRKKRTHIKIIAKEKNSLKNKQKTNRKNGRKKNS